MKDCGGQEIVAIKATLSWHTNRHPCTSGASWGWIEGCDKNICWSNESSFDETAAAAYVSAHNAQAKLVAASIKSLDAIIKTHAMYKDWFLRILGCTGNEDAPEGLVLIRAISEEALADIDRTKIEPTKEDG